MNRRDLLGVVGTALVPAMAGCADDGPENGTPVERDDDADEEDDPVVEIVEHELVREDEGTDEETVAVEGVVELVDEDAEPSYVELRARFYDEDEELLDSTVEQVDAPGVDDDRDDRRREFRIAFPHVGEQAAAVDGYDIEVTTTL